MSASLSTLLAVIFVSSFAFASASAQTVSVAAASDLLPLQSKLQAAFERTEPRVKLKFVNAASGILAQQIENGAPYDVFLSANAQFIDRLSRSGKVVPNSVVTYASGRVGVLWRDGKAHPIQDLAGGAAQLVAVANPQLAPYGAAARQALEHAGLWAAVQKKVVYGENVRQTLQIFDSGNADAVLTAASLLQGRNPVLIPADWHDPIVQKAGLVAASGPSAAARGFLRFLITPAAQAVFTEYGFGKSR